MLKKLLSLAFLVLLIPIASKAQKKLTNEEIWYSATFSERWVSGINSMNDGEHYTSLDRAKDGTEVNKYSYLTNKKVATLISESDINKGESKIRINSYKFNKNETMMLIASEQESIYRHSSKAYYYVVDLADKKVIPLADNKKGKQQLATFSPDGNKIAFVRKNNLFIKSLSSGNETQVTKDGVINELINGAVDWVYEEEFSFHKGFEWSPDGNKIAYYKFDESHVKEYKMEMYGSLYPSHYQFKYPKAGERNSIVSIRVYDVRNGNDEGFYTGEKIDIYLPRIQWKTQDELWVTKLNRHQNKLEILSNIYSDQSPLNRGKTPKVIYSETSDTYIDITDNTHFFNDGSWIFTSEKNGFNHIYSIDKKGKQTQVTSGNWDVISVSGIDQKRGLIYYLSAEDSPMEKQLYVVRKDGKQKKKLSREKGQHSPSFSTGMKYYIDNYSNANSPRTFKLYHNSGKFIKTIEDNSELVKRLKEFDLSAKEFFKVKTSDDLELNAWMIKPLGFDASKKYPVFMYVYGGPGANTVNDSWGGRTFLWHQLLAQNGYIVVSVDNRGTGHRGREFKNCTYQQLGKYETIDQINAAKYLATLPYVDADRIGIQGWSYGGYMSSLCITKGADVFKAAIAVAPVTNWKFYDTVYTERYMRTPQENEDGYDDNSPINHVEKLEGSYLLVHGSADDNVHDQNTMEMIDALVKANKQFDLFIYPDKNHGIYGGTTRLHLFNKMTDFVMTNL